MSQLSPCGPPKRSLPCKHQRFPWGWGGGRESFQCQLLNTLGETEVIKCLSRAELSNPFCIYLSKPIHTHAQINLLDCLPTCSFTLQVSRRCSDIMKKSSKHTYIKRKCTVCTVCIPFKTVISLCRSCHKTPCSK